jgi:O-antigen/teichoic acid export membrane protein
MSQLLSKSVIQVIRNFTHLGFIQVSNALIQLLLFPIIIRKVGIEAFGLVGTSFAYISIIGLLVNYGTGISGVKQVAESKNEPTKLNTIISTIVSTRLLIAGTCLISLPAVWLISPSYFIFFLFSWTLAISEVINPLFLFTGVESLGSMNLANLFAKVIGAIAILLFVTHADDAFLVNFFLGCGNMIAFGAVLLTKPTKKIIGKISLSGKNSITLLKENFPLFFNNLSIQLQQSFFLFIVAANHSPVILGIYAVCDKVIWSFRLFIIAFVGAIFPAAVRMHQNNPAQFKRIKKQINTFFLLVFGGAGLLLMTFPELIAILFTGYADQRTTNLIQWISFVPLFASLNAMNVIEVIIRNNYNYLLRIAVLLSCVTVVSAIFMGTNNSITRLGIYPNVMELSALGLYLWLLRKESSSSAQQ